MNLNMMPALRVLPKSRLVRFREQVGGRIGGLRSGGGFQSDLEFRASVQPTTPQQMSMIEGGEHIEGAISVYTNEDLRTSQVNGDQADRLLFNGEWFKIVQRLNWGGQGFSIYVAGTTVACV
jgi:hypothetical protein